MSITVDRVLLVGAEESVVTHVRDLIAEFADLALATCELAKAADEVKSGRYALLLCHLAKPADQEGFARVIEQATHGVHRIPAVVLSEIATTETKLCMLRAGALD